MPTLTPPPATRARKLGYALVGLLGATLLGPLIAPAPPGPPLRVPQAYRIPLVPGGTALRLAMVHDVLHERYARHGEAYYRERNRRSELALASLRAKLEGGGPVALDALVAFDDLAMGLDHLQQSARAVELLRAKEALLRERWPLPTQPAVPAGRLERYEQMIARGAALREPAQAVDYAWYRTYANLGTALVHQNAAGMMRGEPEARRACEEALSYIERSLEINPQAHFGREVWQAHAIRFFLRASESPRLLLEFDLLGQSLESWRPYDAMRRREHLGYLRKATGWEGGEDVSAIEAALTPKERLALRRGIPRVGDELSFSADFAPFRYPVPYRQEVSGGGEVKGVPFDEPVLAILGMWMLGGGPNPHFALALGGVLERMGQRPLAYAAYSRALAMGERFSPKAEVREALITHCETRRLVLVGDLGHFSRRNRHPMSVEELEEGYARELARGLAYQRATAEAEAAAIAAGEDIGAGDFLSAFRARQAPIATRPGHEDAYALEQGGPGLGVLLCLASIGAWLGLGLERILRSLLGAAA